MPPFKLEALKYDPKDNRVPKMLYCKKLYNQKVKITDWNKHPESQPIDTNPYNPKCYRLHNSHYDRLGNQDTKHLVSVTHQMLKDGMAKSGLLEQNPNKYIINFYTFTNLECSKKNHTRFCPKVCANDYISTMQHSYQAPYPCEVKRLSMPILGNQNKHMGSNDVCKFLDDNFPAFTKTLQEHKGIRHISFNPYTGIYTDGSIEKKLTNKITSLINKK